MLRGASRTTLLSFRGALHYPARQALSRLNTSALPITRFGCTRGLILEEVERPPDSSASGPRSERQVCVPAVCQVRRCDRRKANCSKDVFSKRALAAEMATSVFCPVIRGDTPSSSRFSDAIAAGCLPLLIGTDAASP